MPPHLHHLWFTPHRRLWPPTLQLEFFLLACSVQPRSSPRTLPPIRQISSHILPFTNYWLQALWDISLVLWTWLCLFWQPWFNFGIAESHIIRGCRRIAGCWLQEDFNKPQGEGNLQGTSAGGWKVCRSLVSWDRHGPWDNWIWSNKGKQLSPN